jgi:hypothetical protein
MRAEVRGSARWVIGLFMAIVLAGCGGGASIGFFGTDFDDDSVFLDPVSQSWLGTWTGTLALAESTQSAGAPRRRWRADRRRT